MSQSSLPRIDIREAIDLDSLVYVGPDSVDDGNAFFSGPHGVPFKLEFQPAYSTWCKHGHQPPVFQAMLLLPSIRTKASPEGDLQFHLHYKSIVARLHIESPLSLPSDTRERAQHIVSLMAALIRPEDVRMAQGSFDEMILLLQGVCDLLDKSFSLFSSHPKGWKASVVHDMQPPAQKDDIAKDIAEWFNPSGSKVDLSKFMADARDRRLIQHFEPQPLSGHARLESGARLADWLTRHAFELDWDDEKLHSKLVKLGIA